MCAGGLACDRAHAFRALIRRPGHTRKCFAYAAFHRHDRWLASGDKSHEAEPDDSASTRVTLQR
jgi:hypothetical protein